MNKTTSIIIALIFIIGIIWYASSRQMSTTAAPAVQNEPNAAASTTPESTNVKAFIVEGGDFSFTPNKITVNKGDTVQITFKNNEGFHDLVIDEFQIRTKQISVGQEETIQFVADKNGIFEFYCSVGSHRKMGMVGTLEVM